MPFQHTHTHRVCSATTNLYLDSITLAIADATNYRFVLSNFVCRCWFFAHISPNFHETLFPLYNKFHWVIKSVREREREKLGEKNVFFVQFALRLKTNEQINVFFLSLTLTAFIYFDLIQGIKFDSGWKEREQFEKNVKAFT